MVSFNSRYLPDLSAGTRCDCAKLSTSLHVLIKVVNYFSRYRLQGIPRGITAQTQFEFSLLQKLLLTVTQMVFWEFTSSVIGNGAYTSKSLLWWYSGSKDCSTSRGTRVRLNCNENSARAPSQDSWTRATQIHSGTSTSAAPGRAAQTEPQTSDGIEACESFLPRLQALFSLPGTCSVA